MENYTPGEIFVFALCLVLAAASFINTVGSALEKIAKAKKAAQAPNEEQDRQLKELQEWRKDVDRKLNSDKAQLDAIQDGLQAIFQGQLAMLDHCLDGNNVKQMQDAKTALQHHLITHK
jgi:septal ring factor EnvC (AmiA/AmiB activator)